MSGISGDIYTCNTEAFQHAQFGFSVVGFKVCWVNVQGKGAKTNCCLSQGGGLTSVRKPSAQQRPASGELLNPKPRSLLSQHIAASKPKVEPSQGFVYSIAAAFGSAPLSKVLLNLRLRILFFTPYISAQDLRERNPSRLPHRAGNP